MKFILPLLIAELMILNASLGAECLPPAVDLTASGFPVCYQEVDPHSPPKSFFWKDAIKRCEELGPDWQLPSARLQSEIRRTYHESPQLFPSDFRFFSSSAYWTASTNIQTDGSNYKNTDYTFVVYSEGKIASRNKQYPILDTDHWFDFDIACVKPLSEKTSVQLPHFLPPLNEVSEDVKMSLEFKKDTLLTDIYGNKKSFKAGQVVDYSAFGSRARSNMETSDDIVLSYLKFYKSWNDFDDGATASIIPVCKARELPSTEPNPVRSTEWLCESPFQKIGKFRKKSLAFKLTYPKIEKSTGVYESANIRDEDRCVHIKFNNEAWVSLLTHSEELREYTTVSPTGFEIFDSKTKEIYALGRMHPQYSTKHLNVHRFYHGYKFNRYFDEPSYSQYKLLNAKPLCVVDIGVRYEGYLNPRQEDTPDCSLGRLKHYNYPKCEY